METVLTQKPKHVKASKTLIATIIFFLLANTADFWEGSLGVFSMLSFLVLIIFFITLATLLIKQLLLAITESFKEKNRIYLITFMSFVLITSFIYPRGLINYNTFNKPSFIAQREGAANCRASLYLYSNTKFMERRVCFGISLTKGNYLIKNDTVYFENVSVGRHSNKFFDFGIINNTEKHGHSIKKINMFQNKFDTTGYSLMVTKDELKR